MAVGAQLNQMIAIVIHKPMMRSSSFYRNFASLWFVITFVPFLSNKMTPLLLSQACGKQYPSIGKTSGSPLFP